GSSITYGRRYALSAILGIASEEDDDGNHASGNNESKQHKTEQKKTLSKDMIAELEALRVRAMQTEAEFFANLEKMCKTKVVTYDDLSGIKNLDQVISTIDKALSKKELKEGAK
ncbi:MAG: ERF family protein, partial [Bacillota bacterium]|nr:ERF family protein [Bacillota bacterium]